MTVRVRCGHCEGVNVLPAHLPAPTSERQIIAAALWAYRQLGWRLDDVYDVGAGLRRFWLRAPGERRGGPRPQQRPLEAPLKGSK